MWIFCKITTILRISKIKTTKTTLPITNVARDIKKRYVKIIPNFYAQKSTFLHTTPPDGQKKCKNEHYSKPLNIRRFWLFYIFSFCHCIALGASKHIFHLAKSGFWVIKKRHLELPKHAFRRIEGQKREAKMSFKSAENTILHFSDAKTRLLPMKELSEFLVYIYRPPNLRKSEKHPRLKDKYL